MSHQTQAIEHSDDTAISVSVALKAFPNALRELAGISREMEEAAGELAEAAIDTDDMSLQRLDMLTQYLEGMANFVDCLLEQAELSDLVDNSSLVGRVKPYDLLQRLIDLPTSDAPDTDSDIDLF
ncbi:MAG: hypothetical protein AAGA39_11075 [Pseudomonadota bacterium]